MPNPRSLGQILEGLINQEKPKPEKVRKWRNVWMAKRGYISENLGRRANPGEEYFGTEVFDSAKDARDGAFHILNGKRFHYTELGPDSAVAYKGPVPVGE